MKQAEDYRGSILLVDDTPANLQLLIDALGEQRYDVRPAINGELALESAQALCPDLVLLDINMPGIDGYEVCRRLKADPNTCDVPVIFISSMEETLDKVKAFEAGGVDYISKPFQSAEVLARIQSHLQLRRTQQLLQEEIAERRKVQDELAEHKLHLERLVAMRTAELAERNRELRDEIAHRKELEVARQESEHRYLTLVEEGFDGVFIHQQGKIIYLNQQFADIIGCDAAELIGRSALELVAPEHHERLSSQIQPPVTQIFEVDMLRHDGSRFRAETYGVACTYHGEPARIATVRDISERTRAAAELRASEQRYSSLYHQFETLLDAISDPLVLLTTEMEPIWTNAAYERVCRELSCGPEQGLTLFDVGCEEKGSPVLRCLQSGQVTEELMTTRDRRIWGVKVFPLKNPAGETIQVIANAIDITEKVRLREEANRASRLASLGELAAGIAHEINNPNAVILLNTPILRDAFTDIEAILADYCRERGDQALAGLDYCEMQKELPVLIDRVEESGERIKRIVEDLKNFIRDEGPKEQSQVDLNQVVEAGVRLLENSIKKATSNFQLDLANNLPSVRGDFQKLEQVVVNLVQNACQALTAKDQLIKVTTSYQPRNRRVRLSVKDQGCGIASDQLQRLTDPFFTTKRAQGGTGLGLSVTARILQEHLATLKITSQPGEGATFSIEIPEWTREGA